MKIQLDTDNKTIKLESEVKLSKLIETLKKLLPNNEWKSFTLQTNTVINNWASPIVIHDHWDRRPYWQPWYVGGNTMKFTGAVGKTTAEYSVRGGLASSLKASSQDTVQLKSGVFNVEV